MIARLSRTALLALSGAILLAAPVEAQYQPPAEDPAATITPESYYHRLYFLASDALRGRDTPSQGLEVAAAYLASEHMRMGLLPGAADGSYYQRWPYRRSTTDAANTALVLNGANGQHAIGAGTPLRGASEAAIDGELHFFANLASPPADGEYAGKVLVTWAPGSFSQPWLQRLNAASNLAEMGGALGSIIVVESGFTTEQMADLAQRFAAGSWRQGEGFAPPQVVIRRDLAEAAIPGFAELAASAESGEALSRTLAGTRLTGTAPPLILVDGNPANVVAILPGSDPVLRHEYLVLSAHYDHVGVGTPMEGDSIYNGADDNASGTVSLLEVARAISAMDTAPRRSIMFVHVSGEEKGLLGARWFVDNPPLPVEMMIANLNSDMIGGDAHRDTLVVIGKDYSTLGPLVDEINDAMPGLRLTTSDDLWPDQRFFFRSDQFHFMRKEIPALFFFTGVHECYHRPCDSVQRLDVDKASRIARLMTHATLAIANQDARPEWDPAGLAEVRELTGGGR